MEINNAKHHLSGIVKSVFNLKSFLRFRYHLIIETIHFYKTHRDNSANSLHMPTISKVQAIILRKNHIIEKGLSLPDPQPGFGKETIFSLISDVEQYYKKYPQDIKFLQYIFNTLYSYILFNEKKGFPVDDIKSKFNELTHIMPFIESESTLSTVNISKKTLIQHTDFNYEVFVFSRHSIRQFASGEVDPSIIEQSVRLAMQSPSACNRQAWKVYIFSGNHLKELMQWHPDCRGFQEEIRTSVLITGDASAFFDYEPYQVYVEGVFFAEGLMYAFHSYNIGTIPLSTAFYRKHMDILSENFSIPENEVPIVILGIGNLLDTFVVARSERKPIEKIIRYRS